MYLNAPLVYDIVHHDHNYNAPGLPEIVHDNEIVPAAVVNNDRPQTYTAVFGVQRNTEMIRDNLGYLYHKNKTTDTKIYLVCIEKKMEGQCRATAFISINRNQDGFVLSKQHNHPVRPFNLEVPLLRQDITKRALEKSVHSFTPREIYMETIVNFLNGAKNYTFRQSAERMRRLRNRVFSETPRNISDLHNLLMAEENNQFLYTLQRPPNRYILV